MSTRVHDNAVYERVNEYEFSGASAGQAYALTAAYFDLSVSRVIELCAERATEILQEQRDRGER